VDEEAGQEIERFGEGFGVEVGSGLGLVEEELRVRVIANPGEAHFRPHQIIGELIGFPQALEGLEVGLEELIEGAGAGIAGPVSGRARGGREASSGGHGSAAHAGARRNPSSGTSRFLM
jgi:hypothetical protein